MFMLAAVLNGCGGSPPPLKGWAFMSESFVLKGNICYSRDEKNLNTIENGYLVCENGVSAGAFPVLPEKYEGMPLTDYNDAVIIPGLTDLHIHAPQYSFRGLGMDLELLDWLNTYAFPEESKYKDLDYADRAYSLFANGLKRVATTRACVFATVHPEATTRLMQRLEDAGLVTMVGKVNMDRNCPDSLRETDAAASIESTRSWLRACKGFKNTTPILTPRFIPSCTDGLMRKLKEIQAEYKLPVQSHLSENKGEIAWVKELCPDAKSYGDAYDRFGFFGGKDTPTIMAHCVWSDDDEAELMRKNGVFVAHSPQSNTNLSSGIAPIRKFMKNGLNVGLASDVAGGCHTSIFRAMSDAIQVSKLRWRLVDQNDAALTVPEAFYLGSVGGGKFFGKAGGFDAGFDFDAVVIDDANIAAPDRLSIEDRLARIIYLSGDGNIKAKYVRGRKLTLEF